MNRMLSSTFTNARSILRNEPLNNDQIYAVAPSIFAEEKHDSRSERYTYIPTINIVEGLRKEGFFPFFAAQSKTRDTSRNEFAKHMIRFRKHDQISGPEANEIILINSHDGTSSYQMLAGVFRFVCCNGMVAGDTVENIRIPHKGQIVDDVIEAAYTVVEDFDTIDNSREIMKSTILSLPEQEAFAAAALTLKYDEAPITPRQLLLPKRLEDKNRNDVWGTFNRVQENMMKGGQRGFSASGRRIRTREVNSIDNNVKLNKALWVLAEKMAELKS